MRESVRQEITMVKTLGLVLMFILMGGFTAAGAEYKKPPLAEIKKKLTPEQFRITQQDGTEPAFKNQYWSHSEEGIYVDVVTGEPLFSSADKYDSGTGWPSFTKALQDDLVRLKEDNTLFSKRTEVRSKIGDSHLGHVFDDGPPPTGKRYCMNSAALRFVPLADMEKQGYGALVGKVRLDRGQPGETAVATFAGGCFWCMEPPFEKLDGVSAVISGYTGGKEENPTYEQVSSGATGHTEAVQVSYNPKKVSYEKLLEVFWRNIDPTDAGGQFVDRGAQYRSGIFFHNEEQKTAAEKSKRDLTASRRFSKPLVTPVEAFTKFYPAEEYHQDYYKKSSVKYKYYRFRSGRDQFLDKHWGKPK